MVVKALYEDGVFRPKQRVRLREKAEVDVLVPSEAQVHEDPTGWQTAENFIGIITNTPKGIPIAREHDKYIDQNPPS